MRYSPKRASGVGEFCEMKKVLVPTNIRIIMGKVQIKLVSTDRDMTQFVEFSNELYRGCPYYVPDLNVDIRNTFDPKTNSALEFTDIQAFLAVDENGRTLGRIAGIINRLANQKWNTKTVRFGFIDFVDDESVSEALINAAIDWGRQRGMDVIQGPMGIFDFDKEGMLVEDFDKPNSMITIYNYPYYPKHLERLGFQKAVDWLQVRIDIPEEVPPKYKRVADMSKELFGLRVKKLTDAEIKAGYGKRVFRLLNEAYSALFGYTELTDKQIDEYVDRYMSLIDKQMVPVIENEKGETVGVAITMCSLNDALQKSGGKLLPLGWYHLLKSLKWKHEDHAELLLIAVRPDYQGLGVNALFFDDLIPVFRKMKLAWAETGPQLESNVKELSQWKPMKPTLYKRRRCYRKIVNR